MKILKQTKAELEGNILAHHPDQEFSITTEVKRKEVWTVVAFNNTDKIFDSNYSASNLPEMELFTSNCVFMGDPPQPFESWSDCMEHYHLPTVVLMSKDAYLDMQKCIKRKTEKQTKEVTK